jgi:flavin-dependent dehydrogenase
MATTYDVVVVGARPAGASTAMLLARAGHRVLVLDRSAHGSDTLSTLAIMRAGVLLLERWGVLDRATTATPPLHSVTFDYGDRPPVRVGVAAPLYAPRRTVLDAALADAAAEAGAEVRRGVTVTGLTRAVGGCVTGVVVREPDGREAEVRARLVVGADGRRSVVARDVGAPVTLQGTVAASTIYTLVRGLETDGLEWLYGPGASAGIIPTTDGEACVFVGTDADRFARELRFDMPGAFAELLARVSPSAAERVAAAERTGPYRGFPGQPGWLRRPHGPGWALVGDAGYFKDPATAHGIADALRDAHLLARAADEGLSGRRRMAAAMADYELVRDDLSRPLFEATESIATVRWSIDELVERHLALSAAMQREVAFLHDTAPAAPAAAAA